MTIVLNEHEWARDMIESCSLGTKPFETLSRVAKYYIDNNYSKKETRDMLDIFLLQCEPTASLPKWAKTLDHAVARALKYNAIKVDCIEITKPEMECINTLEGKQVRRLAFTLLCLAKYWDTVNLNGDHWVNNKDSEIMKMANIYTSIKRQSQMFYTLNEKSLIQFSKKIDNTNVKVCFITPGESEMFITDFRNLGYQYLKYCGEPCFECQNCGITVKCEKKAGQAGPKYKYCKDCAIDIHIKQTVNSVTKQRLNS